MNKKSTRKNRKILNSITEIPNFTSEKQESDFWDKHQIEHLVEAGKFEKVNLELGESLKEEAKKHKRMKLISLRLEPFQIEKTKEIALEKGIGYLKLMRNFIDEGIKSKTQEDDISKLLDEFIEFKKDQNKEQSLFRKEFNVTKNHYTYLINVIKRVEILLERELSLKSKQEPTQMLKNYRTLDRQSIHSLTRH